MDVATELRAIWSELLILDGVGDRDNFVALGGDSIAATLCTMRISMVFGIEVDTSLLLEEDVDFATIVREIEAQMTDAA